MGLASSIADCGEQLAWITAVLTPTTSDFVVYQTPYIVSQQSQNLPRVAAATSICFDISVKQSLVPPAEDCWTVTGVAKRGSVVVRGFPIPRQPQTCSGLEVSFTALQNAGYQHTGLGSENICLHGVEGSLALVNAMDGVFIWADLCSSQHTCSAVDNYERRRDKGRVVARTVAELTLGRHIVIPCGHSRKGEDRNACDTTNCGGAGLGVIDGDADAGGSSVMGEPGISEPGNGGGRVIEGGQQDDMPPLHPQGPQKPIAPRNRTINTSKPAAMTMIHHPDPPPRQTR